MRPSGRDSAGYCRTLSSGGLLTASTVGVIGSMPRMSKAQRSRAVPARLVLGTIAGPLFVGAFTAIGANRAGYDWRRHTVSSLGAGRRGWPQRANFIVVGVLYSLAAQGMRQCPPRNVGPRAIPALVAAAGIGLIGSGVFVTDPMGGSRP